MEIGFELYQKARKEIERKFQLLPHGSRLVVYELLNRVSLTTGIVSNINYRDLSKTLEVKSAPGRTVSGIPSKQTIRNYIKSIERECGEHFKVISEDRSLKFHFPELPKIFSDFLKNTEVNIELNSSKSSIGTDAEGDIDVQANREVNTEANIPQRTVKNINIFNTTNTNKLTKTFNTRFCHSKKPIDDDFYPNKTTIEQALSMGLNKVLDQEEISAFIQHNKKNNTQWADFNPVFVKWLERDSEYTKNKQQRTRRLLRSHHHEHGSNQNSLYPEALRRVSELHGISIESIWGNPISETSSCSFIESTLIQSVDTADWNLRDVIYL